MGFGINQPVAPQYTKPAGYVLVYNGSGYDIPAHGVAEITGRRSEDGAFTLRIPSRDGFTGLLVVNSHTPIINGTVGQALFENWPASVACTVDENGADPVAGSMMGVEADSFILTPARPGFRVIEDAVNGVATVVPMERTLVELVRKTSTERDANGWYPGKLIYFDPASSLVIDAGVDIWIVDLNE